LKRENRQDADLISLTFLKEGNKAKKERRKGKINAQRARKNYGKRNKRQ
jgi:hypothetical protein